jgi:hypothetical protein
MEKRENNLKLMGLMATTSPFIQFDSSSRLAMMVHHLEQAVSPKISDIPRAMTGFETQLTTFDIRMPTNAVIVSIHHKYRRGFDKFAIKENPSITIIYQCQETGIYDVLYISCFQTRHRIYGTKLIFNPIVSRLRVGMHIPRDTIFAYSPNLKQGNIFSNGLSCNVVNLSFPCTIEDGYGVSESFCKRSSLTELPCVIGSWGKRMYPLNTYGTIDNFKPFPDIGDKIRKDGLVFAFREYNTTYASTEMTAKALMEIDMTYDIRIYGTPEATVYDVNVLSGVEETKSKKQTPSAMCEQVDRYIEHSSQYYKGILEVHDELEKSKNLLNLSPRLIQLFTRALADSPNSCKNNRTAGGLIKRVYKGIPLDEYRVEIFCSREIPINMGSKITGLHGDKGVICKIIKDEDMPVDRDGNRADVIKFAKATISRMNPGQLYEQYINAASRDLSKWVRDVYSTVDTLIIWERLLAYYKVASPLIYENLTTYYNDNDKIEQHIKTVISDGIYLYIPPNSKNLKFSLFREIEKVISPTFGPVTYRDLSGKIVQTKDNVLVGIQQFIILEKTDQHPMAVSSGLLQHHGLLTGSTKTSWKGHPSKQQTTRVFSESEVRLYASTMGGDVMCDLLNMANSPETHKKVIKEMLEAEYPSRIAPIKDINRGSSRPLMFVNHILLGFGLMLKREG